MEKFIWTDNISVHVEEIDDQHKHFIGIVNSLIDLSEQAVVTREELLVHVMSLGDYALVHFGTEEEHFDTFHYEDADAHKLAHNQYRKQFHRLLIQVRNENNNTKDMAGYIARYAGDWLIQHIKGMDQKFTQSFREHGLR